jgi:tetratricopeptide (TPR) repeat protein
MIRRWGFAALLVLALAGMAWRVLTLTLADQLAATDPGAALAWRPDHPLALSLRAEQLAKAGDWPQASALARRALQHDPLQARAYRVLAAAAAARGDQATALALYRIVARYWPRDLPTRRWLFNHHIEASEYPAAVADIDIMLRAEPHLIEPLSVTLVGLATRPETQPAFLAVLANAPWRVPVLAMVLRQAKDLDALGRLLDQLRGQSRGLEPTLASAWIERLILDRRYAQAYLQWRSELAATDRKVIGNVFNGDFTLTPSNTGFDWRLDAAPGLHFDRLPAGEPADGLALRIGFDGQRVLFQHVRQLLLLPATRYVLTGRVRVDDLQSDRGLIWELRCADPDRLLAASTPWHGTAPWQDFRLNFEVPKTDCRAQWLWLKLPARIPSEQSIMGSIWFDHLRITRLPAAP